MSIERDLQDLTASVRELTRLLDMVILNAEQRAAMREGQATNAPEAATKADPQPQAEAPQPQEEAPAQTPAKTISKEELMQWALLQVRQNAAFKTGLVEVLNDYGVKTISKLKDEDVMAVYAALGGGQ